MKRAVPKEDFTVLKMPHNRFQVFADVCVNRFSLILGLGLIVLLFALPLIATVIMRNVKVSEAETFADAEEKAVLIYSYINTAGLVAIPCAAVLGTGLSGVFGVIRKLVWQDGVLFKHDFFTSVKENGLHFALYSAFAALIYYLVQLTLRGTYFSIDAGADAAVVASVVAAALYIPTIPFSFVQSTVYELGFFKKFVNSFLLAMRTFYLTLPVTALCLSAVLLLFIKNTAVFIISMLFIFIVAAPLCSLVFTLYCDGVLDKFINKDHFPQIVDKGIYRNGDDNGTKTE
ncbi:MAG: hypothetical protein J5762_06970 [Clostridia bacterium]|nr:hypothetical protein [Clostridia bacterium]